MIEFIFHVRFHCNSDKIKYKIRCWLLDMLSFICCVTSNNYNYINNKSSIFTFFDVVDVIQTLQMLVGDFKPFELPWMSLRKI